MNDFSLLVSSIASWVLFVIAVSYYISVLTSIKTSKNTYYQIDKIANPSLNKVTQQKEEAGSRNKVYQNMEPSNAFIDTYMLSLDGRKAYLVCHFVQRVDPRSVIEVFAYDALYALEQVIRIENVEAFMEEPVIALSGTVERVSLHIRTKADTMHYKNYLTSIASMYKKIAKQATMALFCLLIPISLLLLSVLVTRLTSNTLASYMNIRTFAFGFGAILITCLLHYALVFSWLTDHQSTSGWHL